MVQLASAVLRPASLFPQRASSLTAWYVLYGVEQQTRSHRTVPSQGRLRQAIFGTEAKEVYGTSFQSISTSFVLSRDRGSVEAMSTASDISSIGTAYQFAKSGITCYDRASRHSHRRRQQGPSPHRREG